jgi:hypothetical protein
VEHPNTTIVIDQSQQAVDDARRIVTAVREGRRAALETATAAIDQPGRGSAVMPARLERLSRAMGRSPVIEQAKGVLVAQYGISRGEAFELLTELSNRSNRKLRDVADQVVTSQRRRATTASSPR